MRVVSYDGLTFFFLYGNVHVGFREWLDLYTGAFDILTTVLPLMKDGRVLLIFAYKSALTNTTSLHAW